MCNYIAAPVNKHDEITVTEELDHAFGDFTDLLVMDDWCLDSCLGCSNDIFPHSWGGKTSVKYKKNSYSFRFNPVLAVYDWHHMAKMHLIGNTANTAICTGFQWQ